MSTGGVLLIFCLAMVFLVVLTGKFKVHAALSLIFTVLFMGIALGMGVTGTVSLITEGFGSAMSAIGIVIFLGVFIGVGLEKTGSAMSINSAFSKITGEKHLPLAAGLSAFILSIPVFGDITLILLHPVAAALNFKNKVSMKRMAYVIGTGATMTHALIPPTPGILAATLLLGADLGAVIFVGALIGLPVYLFLYFVAPKIFKKLLDLDEPVAAADEYIESMSKRETEATPVPSTFWAFAPILIPVLLIACNSVLKAILPEGASILSISGALGDRVIAMLIGVLIVTTYAVSNRKVIAEKLFNDSLIETVYGSWVNRAIGLAAVPLMITALAGPFGKIIGETGISDALTQFMSASGLPLVIVPLLLAIIVGAVGGSATLAVMTAAGLSVSLMGTIGYSPEFIALLCGLGSITISLMNQSMFWVDSGLFKLNTRQTLQVFTFPCFIASVLGIILLFVYHTIGIV